MSLYDYQEQHLTRLLDIFTKHKVAIDCSITGAGKTIVAVHLAQRMLRIKELNAIIIVCPPTLKEHWSTYINSSKLPAILVSSHALEVFQKRTPFMGKYLLIVDECHLFKNNIQRTRVLKNISKKSEYSLMLSATPYDDKRQFTNIQDLFGIESNIQEHISKMDFNYKTQTHFNFHKVSLSEEESKQYNKGLNTIYYSVVSQNGVESTFRPSIFTAGIQIIHDTLIPGCVEYLKACMTEKIQNKFVVVLNFLRHFEYLQSALTDIPLLILNGQTPMNERHLIIQKFQADNLDYRIIAISAEVGSVGIELDDKSGNHPRHMICLPMTNAVNFCQAIGRIQRTKTLSDSRVSVIQPNQESTYFKHQIDRKFQVLSQFMTTPVFSEN